MKFESVLNEVKVRNRYRHSGFMDPFYSPEGVDAHFDDITIIHNITFFRKNIDGVSGIYCRLHTKEVENKLRNLVTTTNKPQYKTNIVRDITNDSSIDSIIKRMQSERGLDDLIKHVVSVARQEGFRDKIADEKLEIKSCIKYLISKQINRFFVRKVYDELRGWTVRFEDGSGAELDPRGTLTIANRNAEEASLSSFVPLRKIQKSLRK